MNDKLILNTKYMETKIKLLKKISLDKLRKIASQSLNKTKQSLNKTFQNLKKKRKEEVAKKIKKDKQQQQKKLSAKNKR